MESAFSKVRAIVLEQQERLSLNVKHPPEASEMLQKITWKFIRYADVADVPVSYTVMKKGNCEVHLNFTNREAECPALLKSRFDHESTHAVRFLLALQQEQEQTQIGASNQEGGGKRQKTDTQHGIETPPQQKLSHVPKKTPPKDPPLGETRYKLTERDFHSGYLVEHIKNGGIVVELRGQVKDVEEEKAKYACVVSVERDAGDSDWENMTCSLWDGTQFSELKQYKFNGYRITRKDDD